VKPNRPAAQLTKWILPLLLMAPAFARAQTEYSVLRRLVAFPVDAPNFAAGADKAWWKIREELTTNRRFLIASKQFMIRKDVFQPRKEMEPSDVILLGKLLDAQGLIVTYLRDRQLFMSVYSGETGITLWKNQYQLHPSVPISDQLEGAALKLIQDFVSSIPYQGFQIVDPLIGKTVFEEGWAMYSKVEVGTDASAQKGDAVQWVRHTGSSPLFQEGGQVTIIAEGVVADIERDILTVEIRRVTDLSLLKEKSLVRLPKEQQRLQEAFALKDRFKKQLSPEMLIADMKPSTPESNQNRSLLTAVSSIASFAALVLLAF
jgi:hypothetical protein